MQHVLTWLPLIAGVAVMVANALLKHYDDKKGFARILNVIIDILSPFTRKDSPGTLKLPGKKSRVPPIEIELEDDLVEQLLVALSTHQGK